MTADVQLPGLGRPGRRGAGAGCDSRLLHVVYALASFP
jgi:hypothetical protein